MGNNIKTTKPYSKPSIDGALAPSYVFPLLKMKRDIVRIIVDYLARAELSELFESKNRTLFRLVCKIKHNDFTGEFLSKPSKLKFSLPMYRFEGSKLPYKFTIYRNHSEDDIRIIYKNGQYIYEEVLFSKNKKKSTPRVVGIGGEKVFFLQQKYFGDKNYLICLFGTGEISLFDLLVNKEVAKVKAFGSKLNYSAVFDFLRNEPVVISGPNSYDKINIFTVPELKWKRSFSLGVNLVYLFITKIHDTKQDHYYIVVSHDRGISLINIDNQKLSFELHKDNMIMYHVLITNENNIVGVDEITQSLKIWSFTSKSLLKSIDIKGIQTGMTFWRINYLILSTKDGFFVVNLENNKVIPIKNLKRGSSEIGTMIKLFHPQHGECLMTGGHEGDITLWKFCS